MAVPFDAIRAIHNAFRKDMTTIDMAAYEGARERISSEVVAKRYVFFNEVLVWHASGEEDAVFPAVESVAPLVAEAYERDHRGLDKAHEFLDKAVRASAPLEVALAAAAYSFHLRMHLRKEEDHLYRIFNERVPLADQGAIIARMSQKVPQERFPEVVAWLFPLIGPDDRENMTRIWRQALPEAAFGSVLQLIRQAIGEEWAELSRRIPELD